VAKPPAPRAVKVAVKVAAKPSMPKDDQPGSKPPTPKAATTVVKPATPNAENTVAEPPAPHAAKIAAMPSRPKVATTVAKPRAPKAAELGTKQIAPKVDTTTAHADPGTDDWQSLGNVFAKKAEHPDQPSSSDHDIHRGETPTRNLPGKVKDIQALAPKPNIAKAVAPMHLDQAKPNAKHNSVGALSKDDILRILRIEAMHLGSAKTVGKAVSKARVAHHHHHVGSVKTTGQSVSKATAAHQKTVDQAVSKATAVSKAITVSKAVAASQASAVSKGIPATGASVKKPETLHAFLSRTTAKAPPASLFEQMGAAYLSS